jgi:hypothetical protein
MKRWKAKMIIIKVQTRWDRWRKLESNCNIKIQGGYDTWVQNGLGIHVGHKFQMQTWSYKNVLYIEVVGVFGLLLGVKIIVSVLGGLKKMIRQHERVHFRVYFCLFLIDGLTIWSCRFIIHFCTCYIVLPFRGCFQNACQSPRPCFLYGLNPYYVILQSNYFPQIQIQYFEFMQFYWTHFHKL